MFITHLLCIYISVFTLCPHVNVLCCAYMTNLLFIQKVKVTERKHLIPKHNVSSSLRVFVQNLLKFFLLCSLMSIWECFVLVFIWQTFLTAYKVEDKVTERKLLKMFLNMYFIYLFLFFLYIFFFFFYLMLYVPTHCSSNVIVPGFYSALINAFQKQLQYFNK